MSSAPTEDTNTGYNNPHAQLFRDNNDDNGNNNNNQGAKIRSDIAAKHADDCCCCCCCGAVTYHCAQGFSFDQTNENRQPTGQGAAKCPGTDQCGPGICPVGQCPDGVCDIGSNQKNNQKAQNQNNENSIPGGGMSCNCKGKGKL